MGIPIVSVIGYQGSGKTTLLTRLIPLFSDKGYRVGTVKHVPHEESPDRPEKDSYRHRASGAERTLVIGGLSCGLFWTPPAEETIEDTIERCFQGFDLVLVEGFKHGPFPKIEVYRRAEGRNIEPLAGQIDVVAVVTEEGVPLPDGVAVLSPHEPQAIADFLEETFL